MKRASVIFLLVALCSFGLCVESEAAKPSGSPKTSPAPMTKEQFATKVNEYNDGKIKPKDFVMICDKALKDAESSENKDFVLGVSYVCAIARMDVNDSIGAHADADRVIEIDPKSPEGYFAKAIIFELEENVQGVVEHGTKAAERTQDEERKKLILQFVKDYPLIQSAISPAALWKAFDENEVAAEDEYKGKLISIKGKISEITTSLTGYPQLTFSLDSYGMNAVNCEFPKDARPLIAKLKKGQEVVIAGHCNGMIMKNIFLRNCKAIQM